MAVIGNTIPTLVDITKSIDPTGKQARIAELLSQRNDILDDMAWREGNLPTGERTTVRAGLPSVSFRRINEGVPRSKSLLAQVDEGAAYLEGFQEVDKALADMHPGGQTAYRLGEAGAFYEFMGQTMTQYLFYGNATTNAAAFTGLTPRYNSLSGVTATNVIDAGGTGSDNASIWLIGWADDKITGIYPKGTKGGLGHDDVTANKDTGDVLYDASGNPYMGYRDHYIWNCGLSVKDWRYAIRIANIDMSNQRTFSSAANLQRLMIIAMGRLPRMQGARFAFYLPRSLFTAIDIQTVEGGNMMLSYSTGPNGQPLTSFRGVPLRMADQLLETEARVV